jgi:uncharacterized surface protein with fasciclin (FAS1) repeats
MNLKPFLVATALAACTSPAFAQNGKSKSDPEKTKTTADGMTTKTKMADDGKMKVKGKSDAGDKLKAKTLSRKGDAGGTSMTGSAPGVMVGGALMTPDKDIVDNAAGSADHTTLVAAVKAAGLAETLKSTGPFTVFAPANSAFDKLPAGTVNSLVSPEMKPTLTKILTYHVVPGRLTSADLSNGQVLTTVEGEQLTVVKRGARLMLKDAKGGMATVTIPNVISSNGVTHVVDAVLMPAN